MSALYPINPANPLTALSQDFQAAPGIPVSIVGSGDGTLPANAEFSTISAFGLSNVSSINGAAYRGANPQFSTIGVSANNDSITEGINFGNPLAQGCFLGYNTVPSTFEIKTGANLDLSADWLMQIAGATISMTGVSSINNVNFNALVSTVNGLAA